MDSLLHLRLQLVGRLGLGVAVLAGLGLLALVAWLGRAEGTDYAGLVGAFTLSEAELRPALLLVGLVLLLLAGGFTWLVALYLTFRVAGPMYRFARDVELAADGHPEDVIPIREDDSLQEYWLRLRDTAAAVAAHHRELGAAIDTVQRRLDEGADVAGVADAIERLREVEARARL